MRGAGGFRTPLFHGADDKILGEFMITSTANRQMKRLQGLMKKAKERKKERVFVAEGIKMFREAPGEWVEKVYVAESFLAEEEHRKMLEGYQYETVLDFVFQAVSDTQTPQGILTVLRMPEYTLPQLLAGDRTHILVLESIQDPGNLGTMFRAGEGAGISGIIMNRTTVDLFNPKTIRSTMGSIYRVPYLVTDSLADTVEELKKFQVGVYAAYLQSAKEYDSLDYTKRTAFLIGNESSGLSSAAVAFADACIQIPMEGKVESLNAAVSAAVLMYECSRQRRRKDKQTV